jgi:hypothetical protein
MSKIAIDIMGRAQGSIADGGQALLGAGVYDVWSDVDVYIKLVRQGGTASDVTSSTGYIIKADNVVPVNIPEPCALGVDGGTLKYHQVG